MTIYDYYKREKYPYRLIPFNVFVNPNSYSCYKNKATISIEVLGPNRIDENGFSYYSSYRLDDDYTKNSFCFPALDYTSLSEHYPNLVKLAYYNLTDRCRILLNNINNENGNRTPVCPQMFSTHGLLFLMKEYPAIMGAACFYQDSKPVFHKECEYSPSENNELPNINVQWRFFSKQS